VAGKARVKLTFPGPASLGIRENVVEIDVPERVVENKPAPAPAKAPGAK
jgi:hypothetical protein